MPDMDRYRAKQLGGPALWYCSIIHAICSVFTGAQQTLALPKEDEVQGLSEEEIKNFRKAITKSGEDRESPSPFVLFAWQLPIMFLGYSVATYVARLCTVIMSRLASASSLDDPEKVTHLLCISMTSTERLYRLP